MTEQQVDSLLRADLWERFEVFKGYGKDALLLTLLSYNVGVVNCLATASCFARLSKGIGTATKSTYPFATTKARSCEGCSDVGRQSLL